MDRVLRGGAKGPRRIRIEAVLVFVLCLAAYLPVGRSAGSGDTLPSRLVAFSLLTEGDFDLDEFAFARDEAAAAVFPQMAGLPYYLRESGGRIYSAYTVAPAVLALPVLAPFVLAGVDPASPLAAFAEKVAASVLVALSAVAVFVVLRRRLGLPWSVLLGAAYAFGAATFATSAQGLWQHGPGQLCLALAALWMDPEAPRARPITAAFALGAAVAMRNTNALVVLPLALWLVHRHRALWWRIVLAAAACPVLLAGYYGAVFSALGPESSSFRMGLTSGFRQIPLLEGLFGVLLSPARGLFFHSPILLLAIVGAGLALRARDRFTAALFAGAALVVPLVAKWLVWWGGHCFGPRLLADAAPLWILAVVPALGVAGWIGRALRALAAVLGALTVAIGALGAARYDGRHDAYAFTDLRYENMLRGGGGPVAFYLEDLLAEIGLIGGPPGDWGPPPVDPRVGPDGRPIPALADLSNGGALARAVISARVAEDEAAPEIRIALAPGPRTVGASLGAMVRTVNPARPHAVNGWAILDDAAGDLWDLQGGRFVKVGDDPIRPWSGSSPLPYDVEIRLDEALPELPAGRHRLYFALTDAASTRLEGRASAAFETRP